jgi:poly(A) polymerase
VSERDAAEQVISALRERDHVAYLAGGCVRDMLMGVEPKDFDVATDARPEQIEAYFRKTASVGAAFGVVLVRDFGATIEVATFRSDGAYSDARRPDSVEFSSPEEDAQRRDFTINALYFDPSEESGSGVIDFVGGQQDIEARVLRAVGNADERLDEDHLRALRAVRFAARYGLTIEDGTSEAIRRHATELQGVSVERIGEEIRRMLMSPARVRACVLIDSLGLDDAIFGDERGFDPSVMERLGESATYGMALAALAFGRGHTIDSDGQDVSAQYRARLDLSNADRDAMRAVLRVVHELHHQWDVMGIGKRRLLCGQELSDQAIGVYEAWCMAQSAGHAVEVVEAVAEWSLEAGGILPAPIVTGAHLHAHGIGHGPRFGTLVDAIYEAQLEGDVRSLEEGLALLRKLDGIEGYTE